MTDISQTTFGKNQGAFWFEASISSWVAASSRSNKPNYRFMVYNFDDTFKAVDKIESTRIGLAEQKKVVVFIEKVGKDDPNEKWIHTLSLMYKPFPISFIAYRDDNDLTNQLGKVVTKYNALATLNRKIKRATYEKYHQLGTDKNLSYLDQIYQRYTEKDVSATWPESIQRDVKQKPVLDATKPIKMWIQYAYERRDDALEKKYDIIVLIQIAETQVDPKDTKVVMYNTYNKVLGIDSVVKYAVRTIASREPAGSATVSVKDILKQL